MWLKWMICSMFLMLMALPVTSSANQPTGTNNVAATKCKGCFCPGNPCQLCRLPPHTDDPIPENEPETCRVIREAVPPASFQPGENEYFANLDKATIQCIRSGDVIPNTRRVPGYPGRVYCKPGLPALGAH